MLKAACLIVILLFVPGISPQFYEDKRCKCICPSVSSMLNLSLVFDPKLFIAYVPPNQCTCDAVILTKFGIEIKGYEEEICTRCECKYEARNTTVIFVVVILVMWMIALLVVYMAFLTCLDSFARRKRLIVHNKSSEEVQHLLTRHDNHGE